MATKFLQKFIEGNRKITLRLWGLIRRVVAIPVVKVSPWALMQLPVRYGTNVWHHRGLPTSSRCLTLNTIRRMADHADEIGSTACGVGHHVLSGNGAEQSFRVLSGRNG